MMTPSYSVKFSHYWTFGAVYEQYIIKVNCYVKSFTVTFTVTQVNPIFPPTKIFLLIVAASQDLIMKGRVFDKVCISFLYFFIFGFVLSFPNAFVKFSWIKECLNAKHLFQPLPNLPVRADVYYHSRMPLRLTCPYRHYFVHMDVSFLPL